MSYIKQKNMIRLFVLLFFFTGIVFFPVAVFPDGLQENSVTEKIRIEISKSFIFRSSREITRLSIANPSLADVTMISPTQALIVAKDQVGTTNLIIWHGDDLCEVYDVAVSCAVSSDRYNRTANCSACPRSGCKSIHCQ